MSGPRRPILEPHADTLRAIATSKPGITQGVSITVCSTTRYVWDPWLLTTYQISWRSGPLM